MIMCWGGRCLIRWQTEVLPLPELSCVHLVSHALTRLSLYMYTMHTCTYCASRSALEKLDSEDAKGVKALALHPSPVNQFLVSCTANDAMRYLLQHRHPKSNHRCVGSNP
jgi:hypothetical protein